MNSPYCSKCLNFLAAAKMQMAFILEEQVTYLTWSILCIYNKISEAKNGVIRKEVYFGSWFWRVTFFCQQASSEGPLATSHYDRWQ